MSTPEEQILNDQDAEKLTQYMADAKKALKSMSKNQLIAAVSALLIDKQMLVSELKRLQATTAPEGNQNDAKTNS